MRRFELVDGKSSKFWEVSHEGTALTVRFGKIGTNGQTQTKSFPTSEKAKAEHDKLIKEKTGKGYSEITAAEGEVAPAAPAPAAAPKPARAKKAEAPVVAEDGWIDAGGGYLLALQDGKLVCKNPKGQRLASVPKDVKDSEAAEQLVDVRDWLAAHDKECAGTVEAWMLRSLPTPRAVLLAVWEDPSWRRALESAVVVPIDGRGARDESRAGFLRGVDPDKGIGVVSLDGETLWLAAEAIALPHPILLGELADYRALAIELGFTQGIAQLLRETYPKPADLPKGASAIRDFVGGEFQQLNHALGLCRRHGYRVSGGWAVSRVWEGGAACEARFWIGSEDPMSPTWTDELVWVDGDERPLKLDAVGAVAFSEGMRMGSQVFAGRVIPKEEKHA